MSGPGDQTPAAECLAAEGRDHGGLRASHADRERVIGTLANRIGAFGFSAGGFTVLAAAGGEPDLTKVPGHCQAHPAFFECVLVRAHPLTADIPVDPARARSVRDPWRATKIAWRIEYAIFLPGIVAVLLLPGGPHTSVATVVILITVVYLIFWILGVSLMFGSRSAKRPGRQLPPPSAPGIGE